VWQTLGEKWDQGRDELAKAIFTGSAYMPWPGRDHPTLHQKAQDAIELQDEIARIRGDGSPQVEPEPTNIDHHGSLYGVSYSDMIDEARQQPDRGDNRGISRWG
jgi:hypothetical protein